MKDVAVTARPIDGHELGMVEVCSIVFSFGPWFITVLKRMQVRGQERRPLEGL